MLTKLLIFVLLICLGAAEVLRVPIHKKEESVRERLFREKRFHELRVHKQNLLSRYAQIGIGKFDVSRQPLYDWGDQEYNVRITIGTPGQMFELIPDTAEANTWVVDKSCDGNNSYVDCPSYCRINKDWCRLYCSPDCCNKTLSVGDDPPPIYHSNPCDDKRKFDADSSSTFKNTSKEFQLPDGLGNVSGFVAQDTVTLGAEGSSVAIKETAFGLADRLSFSFSGSAYDGILGLAFPAVSVGGVQPVFQHGIDLGLFDEPVFAIYMEQQGRGTYDLPVGSLTFGGRDLENCEKKVVYVPLASEAVWWFMVDGVGKRTKKYLAMSSLGTTLNLVPYEVMMDLVDVSNAHYDFESGFYSVDCDVKFTWEVKVNGGTSLKVDQSTMIWDFGKDDCHLAVGSWGDDPHGIDLILGVPFLQQFCVVHDVGQDQIGFSQIKKK